jgi:tetratricopeptide (TPR) repeat protein
VPALNNLGVAYEKQGSLDKAKEQYQKALEIDPEYDKARENLERLRAGGEGNRGGDTTLT